MPTFKRRPLAYDANQWFKNGDHPRDGELFRDNGARGEGRYVRYFRSPTVPGGECCRKCKRVMNDHGWIDLGSYGITVCPGDWVVTEIISGALKAVYKPESFHTEFELVGV